MSEMSEVKGWDGECVCVLFPLLMLLEPIPFRYFNGKEFSYARTPAASAKVLVA